MIPIGSTNMKLSAAAKNHPGVLDAGKLKRWIFKGLYACDGERVYLAATKIGGLWCITENALAEFFAAITPPRPVNERRRRPRNEGLRRRARKAGRQEMAMRELKADGWM